MSGRRWTEEEVELLEYRIVMAVSKRRNKSPAALFKKIMFQLNENDEIEEYTGKKKSF